MPDLLDLYFTDDTSEHPTAYEDKRTQLEQRMRQHQLQQYAKKAGVVAAVGVGVTAGVVAARKLRKKSH